MATIFIVPGFAVFASVMQETYSLSNVSKITGVPEEDLKTAAEWIAQSKPSALLYSMGITQHTVGVDNVRSTANLMLLTGNLGVSGGGVNPLRGQNNVQGACTTPPAGRKKWTLVLLTEELKKKEGFETINKESIRLVLKKAKLSLG